jgi:hypothetical protein
MERIDGGEAEPIFLWDAEAASLRTPAEEPPETPAEPAGQTESTVSETSATILSDENGGDSGGGFFAKVSKVSLVIAIASFLVGATAATVFVIQKKKRGG